jgi:hypothetical protein
MIGPSVLKLREVGSWGDSFATVIFVLVKLKERDDDRIYSEELRDRSKFVIEN